MVYTYSEFVAQIKGSSTATNVAVPTTWFPGVVQSVFRYVGQPRTEMTMLGPWEVAESAGGSSITLRGAMNQSSSDSSGFAGLPVRCPASWTVYRGNDNSIAGLQVRAAFAAGALNADLPYLPVKDLSGVIGGLGFTRLWVNVSATSYAPHVDSVPDVFLEAEFALGRVSPNPVVRLSGLDSLAVGMSGDFSGATGTTGVTVGDLTGSTPFQSNDFPWKSVTDSLNGMITALQSAHLELTGVNAVYNPSLKRYQELEVSAALKGLHLAVIPGVFTLDEISPLRIRGVRDEAGKWQADGTVGAAGTLKSLKVNAQLSLPDRYLSAVVWDPDPGVTGSSSDLVGGDLPLDFNAGVAMNYVQASCQLNSSGNPVQYRMAVGLKMRNNSWGIGGVSLTDIEAEGTGTTALPPSGMKVRGRVALGSGSSAVATVEKASPSGARFSFDAFDVSFGDFSTWLSSMFGTGLPDAVAELEIDRVSLALNYDAQKWSGTVDCAGSLPIGDAGKSAPFSLHGALKSSGGIDFTGSMSVWLAGTLVTFTGKFDKSEAGGAWLAFFLEAKPPVNVLDLLTELVSADELAVLQQLSHTSDFLRPAAKSLAFVYGKDKVLGRQMALVCRTETVSVMFVASKPKAASQTLWAVQGGWRAALGLSSLPVVGGSVPPESDVRLEYVSVTYANQAATPDDVAVLNGILDRAQTPEAEPPLLPDAGLVAHWQASAQVSVAGKQSTLALGGMAQPPGQFIDGAMPAAELLQRSSDASWGALEETVPGPRSGAGGSITWMNVGRQVGPLTVRRLGFSYDSPDVWLWVEGSLSVAGLGVEVEGLGIGVSLSGQDFTPQFALRGLGVDLNRPPIRIAGGFASYGEDHDYVERYDGAVIVTTPAIGARAMGMYGKRKAVAPNPAFTTMFVFLRVQAGEGRGLGPPQLQITGFCAGFGYNSHVRMPAPNEVYSFPLMKGVSPGGADTPLAALNELTRGADPWVSPKEGTYWGVFGLKANSCKLVDIDAAVLVEFGAGEWALGLLGLASASFPKGVPSAPVYARIELQLNAQYASATGLLAIAASLTPNSFLIDPSCKPTGGLAFYLWLAKEHAGDFVFTLGGYGPHKGEVAQQSKHYPQDVLPVGYTWAVSDIVSVSGGLYCALLPSKFIIGGNLAIRVGVDFAVGYARASLDASFDTLITWNPFTFDLSIGISVKYEVKVAFIYDSGEVAVKVKLWGPPTGGKVTLLLPCDVHIPISFGADRTALSRAPLTWAQFAVQLPDKNQRVQVSPLDGLLPEARRSDGASESPVGPWVVSAHAFSFTIQSVIPATGITVNGTPVGGSSGTLSIRPMGNKPGLTAVQQVTITRNGVALSATQVSGWGPDKNGPEVLKASVPAALWGPVVPEGQDPPKGEPQLVPGITGLRFTAAPAEVSAVQVGPISARLLGEAAAETGNLPIGPSHPTVGPAPTAGNASVIGTIVTGMQSGATRTAFYKLLADAGLSTGADDPMTRYADTVGKGLFDSYPMTVAAMA